MAVAASAAAHEFIYYFYNADFPLLLLGLYAKNEKSDLNAGEKRKLVDAVKEITGPWQRR